MICWEEQSRNKKVSCAVANFSRIVARAAISLLNRNGPITLSSDLNYIRKGKISFFTVDFSIVFALLLLDSLSHTHDVFFPPCPLFYLFPLQFLLPLTRKLAHQLPLGTYCQIDLRIFGALFWQLKMKLETVATFCSAFRRALSLFFVSNLLYS